MGRKRASEGSFDLLLDTITNTFGGVLFLAILVSLMLRHVGKASNQEAVTDPMTAVEQFDAEAKIELLQAEMQAMLAELNRLPASDPDVTILREELEKLTQQIEEQVDSEADAIGEIIEIQRSVAEARQKLAELTVALEKVEKQASEIRSDLEALQAESIELARAAIELEERLDTMPEQVTLRKPVMAPTELPQVGLYLRYGRVYLMHRWSENLVRQGPNPEHFFIQDDGDTLRATPIPAAGVEIDSAGFAGTIARWLGPFRPSEWVVAVVAHEDSFKGFQAVKAELVRAGYKYSPYHVTPDNPVIDDFGGQGVAQ